MDTKDWTAVSFDEGRATLRAWRESGVRRAEETVELWEHVVSRHPSTIGDELWVVYEQVFIAALDCMRLDVANECVTALSKRFPGSQRVHKLNAMRFESLDKFDEALEMYDKLILRDESNATYRKRRIAVMRAMGRRDEATAELNEYLETFINDTEAWLELCHIHLQAMDYSKAAHCMEELLLAQPYNSLYLQRYAEIKYTQGGLENIELAKQYYAQAVKFNSGNLRALYGLFFCCQWLVGKVTGSKKKELVALGSLAVDKIVKKYQEEADFDVLTESHVKTIWDMLIVLKQSTAA